MKKVIVLSMLLFSSLALAGKLGQDCFDELYARQDLATVVSKLPSSSPATFEQLSNTELALDTEKPLISILANGTNKCHQLYLDSEPKNLHPRIRKAYEDNQNNRMILLIDLYNQKISYGEYIQRRQLAVTKMQQEFAIANQEVLESEAIDRQLRQEQAERDARFFRDTVRRKSPAPTTNCTSNRVGDTVYTNCR